MYRNFPDDPEDQVDPELQLALALERLAAKLPESERDAFKRSAATRVGAAISRAAEDAQRSSAAVQGQLRQEFRQRQAALPRGARGIDARQALIQELEAKGFNYSAYTEAESRKAAERYGFSDRKPRRPND